jgi:hypothetical protein
MKLTRLFSNIIYQVKYYIREKTNKNKSLYLEISDKTVKKPKEDTIYLTQEGFDILFSYCDENSMTFSQGFEEALLNGMREYKKRIK